MHAELSMENGGPDIDAHFYVLLFGALSWTLEYLTIGHDIQRREFLATRLGYLMFFDAILEDW